jgi:hypothetical protein
VTSTGKYSVVTGSERKPVRGARLIHNAHPDQVVEVSLRLRSKSEAKHKQLRSELEKPGFKHISRTEFENTYGPIPLIWKQSRSLLRNST